MSGMHSRTLHFWKALGMVVAVALLMIGCAKTPTVPEADVGQQTLALTECIARTQRTVDAALSAGTSAGEMGPTSTGLADARDALEESRKLLQAGQPQEANARVTSALEECQKLEAQAAQARDKALARQAQAKARLQAEQRLQQVSPCIAAARQAVQAAEAAGATADDLTGARRALANSEATVKAAQQLLAQGDAGPALSRLEAAQSDCLSARDQAQQAGMATAQRKPANYTVARGDSLWRISGQPMIYGNPVLWPLIYRANRHTIPDPDLIYPSQVLTIPRQGSKAEADMAMRRARTREPLRKTSGSEADRLKGKRRR